MALAKLLFSLLGALVLAVAPAMAEPPELRIAVRQSGTVNWEIDTIRHYGFDRANGLELSVQHFAGGPASQIAFQGGEADIIVADWIWVARQRAAGKDYVFLPYSKAVGGLMVPADSAAATLSDLKGKKIGIAGGPLDKSWIILQAYSQRFLNFDLAAETEQVFGSPPLIFKSGLSSEFSGVLNFWHFMARMRAAGMKDLISVDEAAEALGLDPELPLLGYVVKGDMLNDHPELILGFAAASRSAKDLLKTDDDAWARLRPLMPAQNDAEFDALVAGFRAGIPSKDEVDQSSAAALFELMIEIGGPDLVGTATAMPRGVFVDLGH